MKSDLTKPLRARRASVALGCLLALGFVVSAPAFTSFYFTPVQSQLTNDIGALSAIEAPTRSERALLRVLCRGTNVFSKSSLDDGKTLRKLNTLLHRKPGYTNQLDMATSNLLVGFNVENEFLGGTLIPQLPPSPEATAIAAQYNAFQPTVQKLNAFDKVSKVASHYDSARRRVDALALRANQALTFPFPSNLEPDMIAAKIDNKSFRAAATDSTENHFLAVATETNINITVTVDSRVGTAIRGFRFSVPNLPNVQFGTFRFEVPTAAVFTNRTNINYSAGTEDTSGATNGVIFVSTTATEVYGIFQCSGPDFNITDGQFRITISSQP